MLFSMLQFWKTNKNLLFLQKLPNSLVSFTRLEGVKMQDRKSVENLESRKFICLKTFSCYLCDMSRCFTNLWQYSAKLSKKNTEITFKIFLSAVLYLKTSHASLMIVGKFSTICWEISLGGMDFLENIFSY